MKTDNRHTQHSIRVIGEGSKYPVTSGAGVSKCVTSSNIRPLTPADFVVTLSISGCAKVSYNSKRMANRRAILLENDGPRKESTE